MPTRIVLRNDTQASWSDPANAATATLKKGELGCVLDTLVEDVLTRYRATLFMGTADAETGIFQCPVVGSGEATVATGIAGEEVSTTAPLVYDDSGDKIDGTTVRWDSEGSEWVTDSRVITLDSYPTADGTVVYDAGLGKFVVGVAVSATEVDGGTY